MLEKNYIKVLFQGGKEGMVFSFKQENGCHKPGQLGSDISCKHQASPEGIIYMSTGEVKFDKSLEPFPQAKVCRIRPF